MTAFKKEIEIRWSDLDPNFHVRHSAYYDMGAYCRMAYLDEKGITARAMLENHIGPIIFREECIFRSEIGFGDKVSIDLQLSGVSEDYRKFSMRHHIYKGTVLAAILNIDAAWMNTQLRKVSAPPESFLPGFESLTRSEDFQVIISNK